MKDQNKTEMEVINKLVNLRKRIAELEAEVNQRKCVEETLIEYQKVIEGSEDMIAVVDQHYKYLLANARFLQYRSMDREQVVGRSVPDVLGKDVFEKVVKKNLDACFQGEVVQYEMKYIYPELGERDLLVSYFPIENPNGIDRAVSVIRDITGRKRVEEEYRAILRTTMDGFWIADIQGRFLDVNDAYCRLIGYSRDELLNMRIPDVEAVERPEETAQRIQRIMETGGDRFETRHRCKDGRIIDIEVSVNYTEVGGGRLFVFLRDITERKRAEETIQRSEDNSKRLAQENAIMAEIGRIISSTLSIEEVYERFAEEVRKLILFDRISINVFDPSNNTLTVAYTTGIEIEGRRQGQVIPVTGTLSEEIFRTRSSKFIQMGDEGEWVAPFPSLLPTFDAGFRSIMSIPLVSKDQVIGVLHFRSTKPNAYTDQDLKLGDRVGNQIAGAIASAHLYAERNKAYEEREKLIHQLQDALASIKTLRGLLPICASCKKIRDDKGYWNQIESYVRDHSEAEFSHGICPECMKKLYPDFDDSVR